MPSTTRSAVRWICRRCTLRFRWRKKNKTTAKCPVCRKDDRLWCEEESRRRELAKQDRCTCDAYPFPHRSGSLAMCVNNPDRIAGKEPTQEQIHDYRSCLETPRSAYL